MPVPIQIEVPVTTMETVEAIKAIHECVMMDYYFYWKITIIYNEQVVSTKNYNCPYLDIFSENTIAEVTRLEDLETTIFDKSLQIDAMPECEEKTARTCKIIDHVVITG